LRRVAFGYVHELAARSELFDIFLKNDLHFPVLKLFLQISQD